MPNGQEKPVSTPAVQAWLQQGEQLYQAALGDYRALEVQLDELEQKLAAKEAEVNQVASVIGKPPVESNRRLGTEIVAGQVLEETHYSRPPVPSNSNANIARALTGKFGR
jgi:hypothetical protein